MSVRDQYEDWRYLVSSNNSTSRGFYVLVTVLMTTMILLCTAAFVFAIAALITGEGFKLLAFIALPIALVILFVVVKVLSR